MWTYSLTQSLRWRYPCLMFNNFIKLIIRLLIACRCQLLLADFRPSCHCVLVIVVFVFLHLIISQAILSDRISTHRRQNKLERPRIRRTFLMMPSHQHLHSHQKQNKLAGSRRNNRADFLSTTCAPQALKSIFHSVHLSHFLSLAFNLCYSIRPALSQSLFCTPAWMVLSCATSLRSVSSIAVVCCIHLPSPNKMFLDFLRHCLLVFVAATSWLFDCTRLLPCVSALSCHCLKQSKEFQIRLNWKSTSSDWHLEETIKSSCCKLSARVLCVCMTVVHRWI